MAEKKEYRIEEDHLRPTEKRVMSKFNYTVAWTGGNISIAIFMIGASLVPPVGSLNLIQATIALLIGLTITAITLTINGASGHKYGIPYVVQARSAFGTIGLKLPSLLRGIPGLVWFGVQSWVGASAINVITTSVFGFNNLWAVFLIFVAVQAVLGYTGMEGVKWVENIGVVVIIVSVLYMTYVLFTTYTATISANLIEFKGTWGLPFIIAITATMGFSTTIVTNISDYMRDLKTDVKTPFTSVLHWIAFVPTNMFLGLIGLITASVTGQWDPIALFAETLPDSPVLYVSLLFIAFAQITTNLYNNLVPASYVLMDFIKMPYKVAAPICVFLSIATCPWVITSSGIFLSFIQVYTAFFGPIFAVLVTDYYILRKRTLDVNSFYDPEGPFVGVNWRGMISIIAGACVGMFCIDVSWFVTLIPTAVLYYALSKYTNISSKFYAGTIFQDKAK